MDPNYKFPASSGALGQVSPDRVNQQRYDVDTSARVRLFDQEQSHSRDSSVHEKAAKFDTLAFQGKALERRTNDAALKRAMLGREEAESEMRRYRDEARSLRKEVQEGKDRERKVGVRLENVMENYGRAKETHGHTQALWEKEIRRARKDTFKSQSVIVKLQEELKAVRTELRKSQSNVDDEKERSTKREQEAFEARYQLVGLQEELAAMVEKMKLVEQERDALRTIAKNEEIARIAAEGRLPLPKLNENDEFASPRKAAAPLRRVSVMSSLASEDEIENLKRALEWEQHRADRAFDQVEFMEVECRFNCCSCKVSERTGVALPAFSPKGMRTAAPETSREELIKAEELTEEDDQPQESNVGRANEALQRTLFIPEEGIFRTVSPPPQESPSWISPPKQYQPSRGEPLINFSNTPNRPSFHARTPSCEPPSAALLPEGTSLLSLLDAPPSPAESEATIIHRQSPQRMSEAPESARSSYRHHGRTESLDPSHAASPRFTHSRQQSTDRVAPIKKFAPHLSSAMNQAVESSPVPTPPTHIHEEHSEPTFHTISTTTRIPLALPSDSDSTPIERPSSTPAVSSSLDPALSPTMSREEALAMIRERRGRARSMHQTQVSKLMTPKKGREVSAPVGSGMATAPRSARSMSRGRMNRA
ncbi:hypothetical protein V495_06881 [Pseudogymnoascus sp. VKM F-4514 (FW-929)]|nr:hypothetical protein V495_06881 [Pseudogymnoascus sp. VKM F-4514 (FW-929)]KFY58039.1 hypothetical protein V497_05118 [Pseudogymnoascus sp. VKM F-4516 (FW-969)]